MTLPSDLNMLTSSMAWIGWVLSFLSVCWSFLSSAPDRAGARLTFLRGVPLPLRKALAIRCSVGIGSGLLDSGVAHRTLINHVSSAIYAMRPAMASPTHQCGLPGRAS